MTALVVGLIGCGRLGLCMLRGLKRAGLDDLLVFDVDRDRLRRASTLGFRPCSSAREAAEKATTVILSVKPNVVGEVCEEIRDVVAGKLVVSTAAAVAISRLKQAVPGSRVARAMPNVAVALNSSITLISHDPSDPPPKEAIELFSKLGEVVVVSEELLDKATVISGSGPAYVAYFAKLLAETSINLGIDEALSKKLAVQTLLGASKLMVEGGFSDAEIIDMVATPGGLTAEALKSLELSCFKASLSQAIRCAYEKLSLMKR